MSRHRIYFPDLARVPHDAGQITVTGPEAHHALRVKRLAEGDELDICDGAGVVASRARIIETARDMMVVEFHDPPCRFELPHPRITVAAPPVKGDRTEAMIEQLSQVGVSTWIPLIVEYSSVVPRAKRIEKWRRLAIESCKQCGRPYAMAIEDALSLDAVLERDVDLMMYADADGDAIATVPGLSEATSILALVGAEGGFSRGEIDAMQALGARCVRLGDHILRTETAATMIGAATVWATRGSGSGNAS